MDRCALKDDEAMLTINRGPSYPIWEVYRRDSKHRDYFHKEMDFATETAARAYCKERGWKVILG